MSFGPVTNFLLAQKKNFGPAKTIGWPSFQALCMIHGTLRNLPEYKLTSQICLFGLHKGMKQRQQWKDGENKIFCQYSFRFFLSRRGTFWTFNVKERNVQLWPRTQKKNKKTNMSIFCAPVYRYRSISHTYI